MQRSILLVMLLAVAVQQPLSTTSAAAAPQAWRECSSEKQMVHCGQIPIKREFRADRLACCRLHRPDPLPSHAVAVQSMAIAQQVTVRTNVSRNDFNATGYLLGVNLMYPYSRCAITRATAAVPVFTLSGTTTRVTVVNYTVPVLTKPIIQQIKAASLAALPAASLAAVQANATRLRQVNNTSGFIHPGGSAVGPAEIALMAYRVQNNSAVQTEATFTLLDGKGVTPKTRKNPDGTTWAPPTDCKIGYAGPYAPTNISIKYSGLNWPGTPCPINYPALAPTSICGHVSFVELDAQMVYKMALAWYVTGNVSYATRVLNIVDTWANRTTDFGVRWENGPLEAGWGIAAMARALELVRPQDTRGVIRRFINWVNGKPMTNMLYYSDTLTSKNISNFYGNWHSTLAEAYMALGVLSDNNTMYNRGVTVFRNTVADYLKWGKGSFVNVNGTLRVMGECSETMRDMYHSQFGLGGLLQAAEIAWQQDEDLYSASNYSLASAMELHARITNAFLANMSSAMLPPGFRYYDTSMPKPPANCAWQFNMTRQKWVAVWTANGTERSELNDGLKCVLGAGFLPTGWEMGYNHYVGRLGMRLPETAQLLSNSWPEWQEFHWGSGTLTHAESAQQLWRTGVTSIACARIRSRRRSSGSTAPAASQSAASSSSSGSSRDDSEGNATDTGGSRIDSDGSTVDSSTYPSAVIAQDLNALQNAANVATVMRNRSEINLSYADATGASNPSQSIIEANASAGAIKTDQIVSPSAQGATLSGNTLETGTADKYASSPNLTTGGTTNAGQVDSDLGQQPRATPVETNTVSRVPNAADTVQGVPTDNHQLATGSQAATGAADTSDFSARLEPQEFTSTNQSEATTDVGQQSLISSGEGGFTDSGDTVSISNVTSTGKSRDEGLAGGVLQEEVPAAGSTGAG